MVVILGKTREVSQAIEYQHNKETLAKTIEFARKKSLKQPKGRFDQSQTQVLL